MVDKIIPESDSNSHRAENDNNRRDFNESVFMPFGIFNTDKMSIGRAAETLIGRNNERISFIRRLLNSGKGGAYLITGYRGTGRTSFVDYCLDVYEKNTIKRFANSKLAKNWLDKLLSIVFVLSLVLLPGFLASIYAFADISNALRLVLIIPLVIFLIGLVRFSYQPIATMLFRSKNSSLSRDMEPVIRNVNKILEILLGAWQLIVYSFFSLVSFLYILCFGPAFSFIIFSTVIVAVFTILSFIKKNYVLAKLRILCVFKTLISSCYLYSLLALIFSYHSLEFIEFFKTMSEQNVIFELVMTNVTETFVWTKHVNWVVIGMLFAAGVVVFYEIPHIITANTVLMEQNTLNKNEYLLLPECFSPSEESSVEQQNANDANSKKERELNDYENNIAKIKYVNYYKQLKNNSWVHGYLSVWKPLLTIRINLGVDDIDHNNIVYGILRQLKVKYARYFLGIRNMRVVSTKLFMFIVLSLLSIHIGDTLFAFKPKYETENIQTSRNFLMNSSVVTHIFGFSLYQSKLLHRDIVIQDKREIKYKVKMAYIDYSSQCFQVKKLDLPFEGILFPCPKNKTRAKMLNEDWYYWLYGELFSVNVRAWKHGNVNNLSILKGENFNNMNRWQHADLQYYYFLADIFMNVTVSPFKQYDYKLPKNSILKMEPDMGDDYPYKGILDLYNTTPLEEVYAIRAYHVYVFVILLMGYFVFNRYIPILPYRTNNHKLKDVMNRLTATQSKENRLSVGSVSFNLPFMSNQVFEPLNVRDIEQHFIDVLHSVSRHDSCLLSHFTSVPTPEITIIFDDLDKLGGVKITTKQDGQDTHIKKVINSENDKVKRAKELLSNLKNVIGAGYCRFIFIGGRQLHEEWLAEQTKRKQLLSSVFDMVIYLPSLLTDAENYGVKSGKGLMLERIKEYISQQYLRANRIFDPYVQYERSRLMLRSFAFFKESEAFADQRLVKARTVQFYSPKKDLHVQLHRKSQTNTFFYMANSCLTKVGDARTSILLSQFSKYLAYRSQGIPKRINEVFAGYIKPLNRVLDDVDSQQARDKVIADCKDVLLLTDVDLYRIQFTCRLYNRIDMFMGRKIATRDDKLVLAVLFVTDYLLKFHGRAFDWDSLEIIEDIADINRTPDLRDMIHDVVNIFAEMMLHPILNGMYFFKFKSSTARELVYMSKLSEVESAAFNFTLDESQSLKKMYIHRMEAGNNCVDSSSILAELYQFDQEYDLARSQYYETIRLADERLSKQLKIKFGSKAEPHGVGYLSIMEVLESKKGAPNSHSVSFVVDWLIFRLRLMLKVGLTFEHTRNYERAHAIYHEVHMLSRRAIRLMMNEKTTVSIEEKIADFPNSYFTAKHFSIIYQAAYAKAWLAEKTGNGVDTSLTIVKLELNFFENIFSSFSLNRSVCEYINHVEDKINSHASFGLIKSELFDKAGDLCFFKGSSVNTNSKDYNPASKNGYLYKASYYYYVALHYLRLFNNYRIESARVKYTADKTLDSSFSSEHLAFYPSVQLSSILADIAEVIYARIDLEKLVRDLNVGYRSEKTNGGIKNVFLMPNCKKEISCSKLEHNLTRFMISTGVYFDNWLKFNDPADGIKLKSTDYIKEARKILNTKYEGYAELLSLWYGCSSNPIIKVPQEFIKLWLGEANKNKESISSTRDKVKHGEAEIITCPTVERCDLEKICCYLSLVNMSITHLRNSGNIEDAAYEMRRAVDSVLALIDHIILIKKYRVENNRDLFNLEMNNIDDTGLKVLAGFLVSQVVYFIDRAAIFHSARSFRKDTHEQRKEIDRFISSKLVLSSIRLCVAATKLSKLWFDYSFIYRLQFGHQGSVIGSIDKKHTLSLESIIRQTVESDLFHEDKSTIRQIEVCLGKFFSVKKNQSYMDCEYSIWNIYNWQCLFNELLLKRGYTNRYPILNRLNILNIMVTHDSEVRYVNTRIKIEDTKAALFQLKHSCRNLLELLETEELYNSPFHFTPMQLAFACYSMASQIEVYQNLDKELALAIKDSKLDAKYFYIRAAGFFSRARQMYTMADDYYRTISDLYYLYDDFNDRYIHHSKSIQIMSASLALRVETIIRERLKILQSL